MSEAKSTLSIERLREVLDYDPDTGVFLWRVALGRGKAGAVAGVLSPKGRRMIGIDQKNYTGARLAWFYVHGEWPRKQIDHINGVRNDNRIANLRDVTPSVNSENVRPGSRVNRSGSMGVNVSILPSGRVRFIARLRVRRKGLYLGSWNTREEAYAAYLTAKRLLHEGCTI
jgi:hypothetical protein